MPKSKKSTIQVQGHAVTVVAQSASDYISLTDIARYRNTQEPFAVINNWMRSRSTIEFIGLWEKLCNPLFKPLEFERFKNEAGSNYFVLSPQRWIESTQAIGIISKSGMEIQGCNYTIQFLMSKRDLERFEIGVANFTAQVKLPNGKVVEETFDDEDGSILESLYESNKSAIAMLVISRVMLSGVFKNLMEQINH